MSQKATSEEPRGGWMELSLDLPAKKWIYVTPTMPRCRRLPTLTQSTKRMCTIFQENENKARSIRITIFNAFLMYLSSLSLFLSLSLSPFFLFCIHGFLWAGWYPGPVGLLRGDRPDAGPGQSRHRHRHRTTQVCQAWQSKVYFSMSYLLLTITDHSWPFCAFCFKCLSWRYIDTEQ